MLPTAYRWFEVLSPNDTTTIQVVQLPSCTFVKLRVEANTPLLLGLTPVQLVAPWYRDESGLGLWIIKLKPKNNKIVPDNNKYDKDDISHVV